MAGGGSVGQTIVFCGLPWRALHQGRPQKTMVCPTVILAAFLSLGCAGAADWPQFRGPNASGVAEATRLPVQFGPEKNVVWKAALPFGHSSPVIWGDRIF